jgi:hypothetical protein
MASENANAKTHIIPPEFLEPNWRLWSFILLIGIAMVALFQFPMKPFEGYIDPFYSPTLLIVPVIGLFRLTCYAFRKGYHRHIFVHPVQCELNARIDTPARHYSGETGFLRIENLHRYFMYFGALILPFFYYDFYLSVVYAGAFTLRLGSLIMLADTLVLTLWVFSCHSVRHLLGGNVDCYGCRFAPKQRNGLYRLQSALNAHHEGFAWAGLIMIVFVDLYLRALAAGIPLDMTLLHLAHL